eukprot:scaffold1335_cov282-Chaetoceros_neogracile.AAC.24
MERNEKERSRNKILAWTCVRSFVRSSSSDGSPHACLLFSCKQYDNGKKKKKEAFGSLFQSIVASLHSCRIIHCKLKFKTMPVAATTGYSYNR